VRVAATMHSVICAGVGGSLSKLTDAGGFYDDLLLVDSTPVECARSRETVERSALGDAADYGYCASHSRYFRYLWGFRLHAIFAPDGTPRALAPAKHSARWWFEFVLVTLTAVSTYALALHRRRVKSSNPLQIGAVLGSVGNSLGVLHVCEARNGDFDSGGVDAPDSSVR